MALARIITRSHACSRQLAIDLLARGYAVEIVSPDKIPDNLADLELRVDTGPGDRLVANVAAHDGERSASLEFIHHLKSPMGDFIRRPPQPRVAAHFSEEAISFNAEPEIEEAELPAAPPRPALETVTVAAETLPRPEQDTDAGAREIALLEAVPSLPLESQIPSAQERSAVEQVAIQPTMIEPIIEAMTEPTVISPLTASPTTVETISVDPTTMAPTQEAQALHRPAGWFWRAGLSFAVVVLLALAVGFGVRRSGKASAPNFAAAPAQKVAATFGGSNLLSAADHEKDRETSREKATGKEPERDAAQTAATAVAVSAPPPAIKPRADSELAPKEPPAVKTKTAVTALAPVATTRPRASSRVAHRVSHRHVDDLIAPDTVTYLDKRAAENAAARAKRSENSARRHASPHKGQGVVAASTVTYLGNGSTPKSTKPSPSVKQPSNLN